jgi:hypothetical protein
VAGQATKSSFPNDTFFQSEYTCWLQILTVFWTYLSFLISFSLNLRSIGWLFCYAVLHWFFPLFVSDFDRTFTQVSVQWQDIDSIREELDDLQV